MQKLNIKNWNESDRPREKLLQKGPSALSVAELIAILINSGNKNKTAVELSREILNSVANNLSELSKKSANELMKFDGIGEAKAISIIAALELGRRRAGENMKLKQKITGSKDAYNCIFPELCDKTTEEFWIILLDRSNGVIKKQKLSHGGLTGTVVDIRETFRYAIENKATGIIVCHNHPSGNINPSDEDKKITSKLKDASKLMDINLLDHIIFGENSYFSFADEGLI